MKQNHYYFHQEYLCKSFKNNIHNYRMRTNDGNQFVVLTNANAIEIYRLINTGISFYSRHTFTCNIAKIEILPSKHHDSDFIFIVDQFGRFAIWRPDEGYQLVENNIVQQKTNTQHYKSVIGPDQQLQFCESIYSFNVNDTKGTIFYTVKHQLVTIDFLINKQGILVDSRNITHYKIPYMRYRYIGWVRNLKYSKLIGIIEENEEKTILKVHNLDHKLGITAESVEWKMEKINMLQFYCEVPNEIVVLTYNQISLHSYKSNHPVCNYRTRGNYGQACFLGDGLYAHIGDQLTVFSRSKLKGYGPLKYGDQDLLEHSGLTECKMIGSLKDGGKMLAIAAATNQLYFIIVYDNKWKMLRHMKAISTIFSLHTIGNNPNSILAVTNNGLTKNQVCLIEKQSPCSLLKQQSYQFVINNLFSLNEGRYMIISSRESNLVMVFNGSLYEQAFQLPYGYILCVSNSIVVMDNGILILNYSHNRWQPCASQEIVLAQILGDNIFYSTPRGQIVRLNVNKNDLSILRNDCYGDYCWSTHQSTSSLLCASAINLDHISILDQTGQKREIKIKGQTLINSLGTIIAKIESQSEMANEEVRQHIVIGYIDGTIEIVDIHGHLQAYFGNFGNEPVSQLKTNASSLVLLSGSKQFILSYCQSGYKLKQIQFSSSGNFIGLMIYSQVSESFLYVQSGESESSKVIKMSKINNIDFNNQKQVDFQMQFGSVITNICEFVDEIPMVYVDQDHLFVAVKEEMLKYDIKFKKLMKRQYHFLKEVVAIDRIDLGLIVAGIDLSDNQIILLISQEDIEVLATMKISIKSSIKSIKTISNSNRFFCRHQALLTLYEILPTYQTVEIMAFNMGIQGFSLDINQQYKKIVCCDPYRYTAVFDYDGRILPLARYIGAYQITEAVFLQKSLVVGDARGTIYVLQFNFDKSSETLRTEMTKVCGMNIGEQISCLLSCNNSKMVYYGGACGKVGRLRQICKQQFDILKRVEEEAIRLIDKNQRFSYEQWRSRTVEKDKLIDEFLVRKYLQFNRKSLKGDNRQFYHTIYELYQKLIH